MHLSAEGGEAGLDSLPQRRSSLRVGKGITLRAKEEKPLPSMKSADGRLKPQAPTSGRAFEVREAMKHAWGGYVQYAWGADELQPVSKSGSRHGQLGGLGASIIDSLSTLWLMDLEEEFNRWGGAGGGGAGGCCTARAAAAAAAHHQLPWPASASPWGPRPPRAHPPLSRPALPPAGVATGW